MGLLTGITSWFPPKLSPCRPQFTQWLTPDWAHLSLVTHGVQHNRGVTQPWCCLSSPPLSRGAVNPQCHLSPLLTFLSEAHYSHDTFWQSLKILLLISLPLKDDRDELLGKTWNLCSTWVLNQRNSKEGKDNKPIYYNIVPKPSKKVISVSQKQLKLPCQEIQSALWVMNQLQRLTSVLRL